MRWKWCIEEAFEDCGKFHLKFFCYKGSTSMFESFYIVKSFILELKALTKSNYDINLKPLTLSRRSKRSEIWKAYMALWQSSRWLRCLHDDIKAFKGLPMKISDKWDHHAITSFIYIAPVLFSSRITTPAYKEDDCATNIYDIASHKPFSSRQQKLQRQGRRVWMF